MIPNWPDAACAWEVPELFFPEMTETGEGPPARGARRQARAQAEMAKAICRDCPRMVECLERALELKVGDGVWGGVWFHNGNVAG